MSDYEVSTAGTPKSIMKVTPAPKVEIFCQHGENVKIDASGDEVVVTGASEEGARIFFTEILKPMIDNYMAQKKKENA